LRRNINSLTAGKRIATLGITAVVSPFEPGITLLRGTMGKAIWHHSPLALLLQTIIANRLCRIQCLLQIALLSHFAIQHKLAL